MHRTLLLNHSFAFVTPLSCLVVVILFGFLRQRPLEEGHFPRADFTGDRKWFQVFSQGQGQVLLHHGIVLVGMVVGLTSAHVILLLKFQHFLQNCLPMFGQGNAHVFQDLVFEAGAAL